MTSIWVPGRTGLRLFEGVLETWVADCNPFEKGDLGRLHFESQGEQDDEVASADPS